MLSVALHTKVNHSRVLHEIRRFIQTETQRSVWYRALQPVGKTISIRYIDIERRLTSVLDDAEVCEHRYRLAKSIFVLKSLHASIIFSNVVPRYELVSL